MYRQGLHPRRRLDEAARRRPRTRDRPGGIDAARRSICSTCASWRSWSRRVARGGPRTAWSYAILKRRRLRWKSSSEFYCCYFCLRSFTSVRIQRHPKVGGVFSPVLAPAVVRTSTIERRTARTAHSRPVAEKEREMTLVGPFMGPVRTAPVVLLTLNPGFSTGEAREAAQIPAARESMANNLGGDAPLPARGSAIPAGASGRRVASGSSAWDTK